MILWLYNQNPILDGTLLYGGYADTSVGGSIKYFEKPPKVRMAPKRIVKKRFFERRIEY